MSGGAFWINTTTKTRDLIGRLFLYDISSGATGSVAIFLFTYHRPVASHCALWCFNGILSRKLFRSKVKQCWWERPWVHFCGPSFNARLPSTSDKATAGSLHAEPLFKLFLTFFLPLLLLLPHLFLLYPWRIYNVIHWNFKTDRGGKEKTFYRSLAR